tara:strand:- start:26 stop:556 length:531 start_codon:yes stop_codon:yes gene_type:complete
MAQLAKLETKKIRISKDHLLREKELLLADLDKQDSRKQMVYTFLIFLFLGSLMLEETGRNLAMAIVVLAFVGVSVYKNPEVLDAEKQILEIDQKLELFDTHPEKIQSEFERKPKKKKDSRSKSKNKSDHKNSVGNEQSSLEDKQAENQIKSDQSVAKTGKKSRQRRRHRSKSNKSA